ncbi:MAG: hypothetical protein PHE55_01335 [Methylococcaceae bacterium]|nr:hypothetical protein [Methylococcaceae bacterium]
MLLNLVKIRYGDTPIFLGVQSVISQYSLAGTINLSGGWNGNSLPNSPWSWVTNLSGNAQYRDRPTISFAPMTGERFAKSMLTPIPPTAVVSLLQAGFPARMILRLSVQSINGLQNQFGFQAKAPPPDERFYQSLDLISDLQQNNQLGMRTTKDASSVILTIGETQDENLRGTAEALRELLGLDPSAKEFSVVYGAIRSGKDEIAMLTRSMLDVLTDLSGYIEIPSRHLAEKRAFPSQPAMNVAGRSIAPLFRIHSGPRKSDDAFVAVSYHDQWFWLDDRDIDSKLTFSFLMFMFALVETHDPVPTPAITIPTR